tara:strand:+ start:4065 stop:5018 length:954 start_codon:yes stop_codon:yes gene_type:complete
MILDILSHQIILTVLVFFISLLALRAILPFLRKYCIDIPNQRSSHKKPTPSGGGLIFPIIGIPLFCLQGFYLSLFCLPISLIGFWDDIYSVSIFKRLLIQTLSCLFIFTYSPFGNYIFDLFGPFYIILITLLVIFLSVGMINLINFADGIDGMLTGNMMIILFSYAYLSEFQLIPFISILFAFWFFNKSPARIFMGDCGSNFLGIILVFLLLQTSSLDIIFSILIIGVPIFGDTTWTLLKKVVYKKSIFKPHKLHMFQRLNQAGWSHGKITLLYMSFTFFLSLIRIFINLEVTFIACIFIIGLALFIDKKYAKSFEI